ncbi:MULTISPECIES: IclR family transcriptional regulator [unclassified Curtobacterium]|uniref:IclR family transcriptional regulator n=1 Tax=unclassified Curtobacterium TaxID=257496 RepID=UPI001C85D4F2|nr:MULTISPECIES: helix-turn-helix domain-containing protein [unclassified Curtobacterium]
MTGAGSRTGMVERAFAVLGAFDDRHRVLTLTELGRRSGLPVNTTLRIVRDLVGTGALERRADGTYVVGLRLFEIAALAPRSQGLRALAMPSLEDLHAVTEEHVLLTVREDDEAVLVERLSARGAGRVRYRVGGRMPLDRTGGGLVLLAHAPTGLQDAVIATTDGSGLLGPGSDLRRQLAAIRREHVLVAAEQTATDGALPMGTVAAPVVGPGDVVVAAVSVVLPADPAAARALVPAVRTTVRAISRALVARR